MPRPQASHFIVPEVEILLQPAVLEAVQFNKDSSCYARRQVRYYLVCCRRLISNAYQCQRCAIPCGFIERASKKCGTAAIAKISTVLEQFFPTEPPISLSNHRHNILFQR